MNRQIDPTRIRRLDHPKTSIHVGKKSWVILYGWTQEIILHDGTTVPMRECIGIYDWRWTARLAEYRWLRKQRKHTGD